MDFQERRQLRHQLRQRRRSLSAQQRAQCAQSLAALLAKSRVFQNSRRIAFYFAEDGELDLQPLMHKAWAMGKKVYLPTLFTAIKPQLRFALYHAGDPLALNRFGIAEPVVGVARQLRPMQLDLVLMPLVGFDLQGNRLGMGGGFYDRSFSGLRQRERWRKPQLVGTAYEFQKLDQLPHAHWDVPMDAVVTEQQFYQLRSACTTPLSDDVK